MKFKELKKLDGQQLTDQLHEARLELAKERAASEIGTAKNPGRIRVVRKTIARIQTIVNSKKIAGEQIARRSKGASRQITKSIKIQGGAKK